MPSNLVLIYVDDTVHNDSCLSSVTEDTAITPLHIQKRITSTFPDFPVYFSVPADYSGSLVSLSNTFIRTGATRKDWKHVFDSSDNCDNCIRIYADAPFVDMKIVAEMVDIHTTYAAEYTYSENVPSGYCCDIISSELVESLPQEDEDKKILPLEKVVKDNINQFDVELYYTEPDIRSKRLDFRTADRREYLICTHIYSAASMIPPYAEIQEIIDSHPEVLYIAPSYLELQLTRSRITNPLYIHPSINTSSTVMDTALAHTIVSQMKEFDLPYHVALGTGDPLLHPSFYEILDMLVHEPLVASVIIETEAAFDDSNFISYIQENPSDKIQIIAQCNGYNNDSYKAIHGTDMFDTVCANIRKIRDIIGNNLYIEILKINETEPFLDRYYDFWEKESVQIILQKQNTYIGELQDRRYYDLTPLTRIPCWHLQRDLSILPDGTVAYCKQDIDGKYSSFNISEQPIPSIWAARKDLFIANYTGSLASKPDCASCDEWFTFNL